MTDERMKEIRFKMWALAQGVMRDAANTRAVMPSLTDEEYEYARNFLLRIVRATQPGGYRELDDDEIEQAQTDYTRGVVDGSEININILSESTALLEEQRETISQLQRDGREAVHMLHDISLALNEAGWPSSPMGVRTRACEAIDILSNLNKALRAERDQLLMQIKEMQER